MSVNATALNAMDVRQRDAGDTLSLTELDLYHRINTYRASQGLGALRLSSALTLTANRHTLDLAARNAFEHDWSPDTGLDQWNGARALAGYPNYSFEVLAGGTGDPALTLAAWQNSAPHNAHLVQAGYHSIGLGVGTTLTGSGILSSAYLGASADPAGPPLIVADDTASTIALSTFADALSARGGGDTIHSGGGNDTIDGGEGNDWVTLGDAGGTCQLAGVETLIGGGGGDWVNLADGGNRVILAAVETLVGGTGGDWITLGNRGNTLVLAAIETLIGGTGQDAVRLGDRGNTLILAAVETLVGGSGQDAVTLGDRGSTMSVSGVDVLVGRSGRDDVTIGSGAVRFTGNGGADRIALAGGGMGDLILFASADDGAAAGQSTGCDRIEGFESGSDRIGVTGALRQLIDANGDGSLAGVSRASGSADLRTDELVRLSAPIAVLTDADFATLRTALGSVGSDGRAHNALVLASDGGNSALFALSDNGDGVIAVGELRLLGHFDGTTVALGDVALT